MKLLQTKPFGEAEETRVSAGSRTRPVVVGARRVESKNRLRLCSTWRRRRLYFMLSVFGGDSDQKNPNPCTVLWLRIPRVILEMCQFGWK